LGQYFRTVTRVLNEDADYFNLPLVNVTSDYKRISRTSSFRKQSSENGEKMEKKATVIQAMSVASFLVLAIGFILVWPAWADYPERPITLTVDPGGTTDPLARALAVGMEKYLGRALVIANKGGAGAPLVSEFSPTGPIVKMKFS
jgi:hypothetical protein